MYIIILSPNFLKILLQKELTKSFPFHVTHERRTVLQPEHFERVHIFLDKTLQCREKLWSWVLNHDQIYLCCRKGETRGEIPFKFSCLHIGIFIDVFHKWDLRITEFVHIIREKPNLSLLVLRQILLMKLFGLSKFQTSDLVFHTSEVASKFRTAWIRIFVLLYLLAPAEKNADRVSYWHMREKGLQSYWASGNASGRNSRDKYKVNTNAFSIFRIEILAVMKGAMGSILLCSKYNFSYLYLYLYQAEAAWPILL